MLIIIFILDIMNEVDIIVQVHVIYCLAH